MLHSFLSYLLRESYFLRIPKVHTNYGAAYLSYRRCTVHHGTGLRSVPPVRVQALRALPRAGARCAPAPCVVWPPTCRHHRCQDAVVETALQAGKSAKKELRAVQKAGEKPGEFNSSLSSGKRRGRLAGWARCYRRWVCSALVEQSRALSRWRRHRRSAAAGPRSPWQVFGRGRSRRRGQSILGRADFCQVWQ